MQKGSKNFLELIEWVDGLLFDVKHLKRDISSRDLVTILENLSENLDYLQYLNDGVNE